MNLRKIKVQAKPESLKIDKFLRLEIASPLD